MKSSAKLVRMVAAARHFYGGRQLRINDEFDCTENDAADLEALRFAVRKKPNEISDHSDDTEPKYQPRKKGEYNRRDMRAKK